MLILEYFEVKQGRVDRKKFVDWCGMSVLDQKKKEQNKDGVVVVPVIVSKSSVTHSMESASLARSQSRLNKRETGTSLMDLDDTSSDDDDDENPLLAANRAAGVRHPGMDALNRALKEVEEEHVKSKNLKALVNKKKIMNGAFGKGHRKHKHREGKESKRFNLDEQIAFKNGGEELHSPLGLKKKKTMTDQRKERGDKRKARQDQLTKQKTLL